MGRGDYDYHLYVDAAGDDGFSFRDDPQRGSSLVFVVAVLAMAAEHVDGNTRLVKDAKRAANVRTDQEIKSSTLKRHRSYGDALEVLSGLEAELYLGVVLKRELSSDPLTNRSRKALTTVAQTFAIQIAAARFAGQQRSVYICVDRQKKLEEALLSHTIPHGLEAAAAEAIYKVDFRDSKAVQMLQAADWCAGLVFEVFERRARSSNFPPCRACTGQRLLCSDGRKGSVPPDLLPLKQISRLLPRSASGRTALYSIVPLALTKEVHRVQFIDCLVMGRGPTGSGSRFGPPR